MPITDAEMIAWVRAQSTRHGSLGRRRMLSAIAARLAELAPPPPAPTRAWRTPASLWRETAGQMEVRWDNAESNWHKTFITASELMQDQNTRVIPLSELPQD